MIVAGETCAFFDFFREDVKLRLDVFTHFRDRYAFLCDLINLVPRALQLLRYDTMPYDTIR